MTPQEGRLCAENTKSKNTCPYGAPWAPWAGADGPGPMGLKDPGLEDPPVGVYVRARGRWGPMGSMGLGDPPMGVSSSKPAQEAAGGQTPAQDLPGGQTPAQEAPGGQNLIQEARAWRGAKLGADFALLGLFGLDSSVHFFTWNFIVPTPRSQALCRLIPKIHSFKVFI